MSHSIYRYLDTVGNGSGTKNANGDYSSSEGVFMIKPSTSTYEVFNINRLIVTIEDTSGMQANEYGNIGSALTNGVRIACRKGTKTHIDITDGVPITTNAEWSRLCYDVDVKSWGTTPTNEILTVRFTLSKAGFPVRLSGSEGGNLAVTLNDTCTGLIQHYFMAQGFIE